MKNDAGNPHTALPTLNREDSFCCWTSIMLWFMKQVCDFYDDKRWKLCMLSYEICMSFPLSERWWIKNPQDLCIVFQSSFKRWWHQREQQKTESAEFLLHFFGIFGGSNFRRPWGTFRRYLDSIKSESLRHSPDLFFSLCSSLIYYDVAEAFTFKLHQPRLDDISLSTSATIILPSTTNQSVIHLHNRKRLWKEAWLQPTLSF